MAHMIVEPGWCGSPENRCTASRNNTCSRTAAEMISTSGSFPLRQENQSGVKAVVYQRCAENKRGPDDKRKGFSALFDMIVGPQAFGIAEKLNPLLHTQSSEPSGTGYKNIPPFTEWLGDVIDNNREQIRFFGYCRFINENRSRMKTVVHLICSKNKWCPEMTISARAMVSLASRFK